LLSSLLSFVVGKKMWDRMHNKKEDLMKMGPFFFRFGYWHWLTVLMVYTGCLFIGYVRDPQIW
jgi:hypothetical protein